MDSALAHLTADEVLVEIVLRTPSCEKGCGATSVWQLKRCLESGSERALRVLRTHVWLKDDPFTRLRRVRSGPAGSVFHGLVDVAGCLHDLDATLLLLSDLTRCVPGSQARVVVYHRDPRGRFVSSEDAVVRVCVDSSAPGDRGHRASGHDLNSDSVLWLVDGAVHVAASDCDEWAADETGLEGSDGGGPSLERFVALLSETPGLTEQRLVPHSSATRCLGAHLDTCVDEFLSTSFNVALNVTLMLPPTLALVVADAFGESPNSHSGAAHTASTCLLHEIIRHHTVDDPLVYQPMAVSARGSFHQDRPASGPGPTPYVIPQRHAAASPREELETAYRESETLATVYDGVDALLSTGRYLRVRLPAIHRVALTRLLGCVPPQRALLAELAAPHRRGRDVPAGVYLEPSTWRRGKHRGDSGAAPCRRGVGATREEIMLGIAFTWAFERWEAHCAQLAKIPSESRVRYQARRANVAAAKAAAVAKLAYVTPTFETVDLTRYYAGLAQLEASLFAPFPPTFSHCLIGENCEATASDM